MNENTERLNNIDEHIMNDKTKILLGLRNNTHRVQLIIPNGETRAVLGTNDPEEEKRRVDIVTQWSKGQSAPRQQPMASIKLPLEQRTQTILYYQLTENERQQLNGGHEPLSSTRKSQQDTQHANLFPSNNSALKDSE